MQKEAHDSEKSRSVSNSFVWMRQTQCLSRKGIDLDMEKRRVVVTGLGAVTPIGNTVDEFWAGIKEGRVGIGPITKFDASEF